jgi:hypothetical protein
MCTSCKQRPKNESGLEQHTQENLSLVSLKIVRKQRGVKNSGNSCQLAWDCGAERYFSEIISFLFVLNIFPILASTANLTDNFWFNRQSASDSFSGLAYSFVFIVLRHCCYCSVAKGEVPLPPRHHSELCAELKNMKIFEGLSNSKNMVFNVKKLLNVGVCLTLRRKGGKNRCKRN